MITPTLPAYRQSQKDHAAACLKVQELKDEKSKLLERQNHLANSEEDVSVIAAEMPHVEWGVKIMDRRIEAAEAEANRILDESFPVAYRTIAELTGALKAQADEHEQRVRDDISKAVAKHGIPCVIGASDFQTSPAGKLVLQLAKLHPTVIQARSAAQTAEDSDSVEKVGRAIDAAESELARLQTAG